MKYTQTTQIDEWGDAICDRCPLPECVGVYGKSLSQLKYPICPIDIARKKDWTIEITLYNADQLGLLDEE